MNGLHLRTPVLYIWQTSPAMKVKILPESAAAELHRMLPVGARAFVFARDERQRLGICVARHEPHIGLKKTGILETGTPEQLALFAQCMAYRHREENWMTEH